MPRRYKRRRYYSLSRPLKKYSNETYVLDIFRNNPSDSGVNVEFSTGDNLVGIFSPSAATLGTRKVKNFTISLASNMLVPFVYALVYVPEGTTPSTLVVNQKTITGEPLAASSFYEPNQNVIMSGMFGGPSGQIIKNKTRLARNLNSNDIIILIVAPIATFNLEPGNSLSICATINYAISY